jgi:SHS2 domain-containing protein
VAAEWRDISLDASDLEILLVDWLNELLYIGEVENLLLVDFRIESLTDSRLKARVGGILAEEPVRDIKAVTFHDLEVVREEGGWSTVVTFDV